MKYKYRTRIGIIDTKLLQLASRPMEPINQLYWHSRTSQHRLHSLFNNLLYQFNEWDLKTQLFKFSASRHQQDRAILLKTEAKAKAPRFEAEAEAVKIAPQGCLVASQCLEAPHHCHYVLIIIIILWKTQPSDVVYKKIQFWLVQQKSALQCTTSSRVAKIVFSLLTASGGFGSSQNTLGAGPQAPSGGGTIISSRWKNWGLDKKVRGRGPPPGPGLEPPLLTA